MDVRCEDFKNTPMEGTPIEKVKGEEVMLAPLEGKVYVRDSDTSQMDRELGIKPGQSFENVIAEKADEIEAWLRLN